LNREISNFAKKRSNITAIYFGWSPNDLGNESHIYWILTKNSSGRKLNESVLELDIKLSKLSNKYSAIRLLKYSIEEDQKKIFR
jgi:hypothetical protein